jgi:hypothetical protein
MVPARGSCADIRSVFKNVQVRNNTRNEAVLFIGRSILN